MGPVILGAAGFLGLNLVEQLLREGLVPRCVRRKRTNVLRLRSLKVPLLEAELLDVPALAAAMSGASLVYHLAGHYPRYSHDAGASVATGTGEMAAVLEAAAGAGVRRLVYVSSTATVALAPDRPSDERDVFASPPGLGTYHDTKWAMEALALAERRLEVVVVCPAACVGPWDLRLGTAALLLAQARGLAPAYPDGVVSLVDVRDVAWALSRIGEATALPGRLLLSAESHPMSALMARLATRYRTPLAPPLGAAQARSLADLQEAEARRGGPRASLARELVDLLIHGPVIDAGRSRRLLGLGYRPLDQTLDAFDTWARRMRLLPEPPGSAAERTP